MLDHVRPSSNSIGFHSQTVGFWRIHSGGDQESTSSLKNPHGILHHFWHTNNCHMLSTSLGTSSQFQWEQCIDMRDPFWKSVRPSTAPHTFASVAFGFLSPFAPSSSSHWASQFGTWKSLVKAKLQRYMPFIDSPVCLMQHFRLYLVPVS